MLKIGILSPQKDYFKDAFSIFAEHNQKYNNRYFGETEFLLEELVVDPFNFDGIKSDVDAIIAYSGFMQLAEKIDRSIPIVEVDIPGIDILRALLECKRIYGNKKVALPITKRNMFFTVDELENIAQIPIKIILLDSLNINYEAMIDSALQEGCEVFLVHYYARPYYERKGIDYVMIRYSKSTIWQAITEAKMAAELSRLSQARSVELNTILDYSNDAILFLNKEGQVASINNKALEVLHIESADSVMNRVFSTIIAGPELNKLLSDNIEYEHKILKIDNIEFILNKAFIVLKGEYYGTLVTLQKVHAIEKLEGEIRKQIHGKGHVAKGHFKDIVGQSEMIMNVIEKARRFSRAEANILITGESGTGKEIIAQSIHNSSDRCDGPFVAINCAALPEHLLESELFGYEEGAFTGAARKGKTGLFELAHRGTVFLDEIGEMPLTFQAKLLRVIQEKEICRLGGVKIIPLDVRFISATNEELEKLIKSGRFRKDLYYRLNVLSIHLPSLNDRREDIPLLAQHFLNKFRPDLILTNEAKLMLQAYDWTGNIRQLSNICEQLGVLCEDSIVKERDIQVLLYPKQNPFLPGIEKNMSPFNGSPSWEEDSENAETETEPSEAEKIINALASVKYNRDEAAKILGINRSTLWRKMKKYGI